MRRANLPSSALLFLIASLTASAAIGQPPYGVGDWPEKFGNHRARIQVGEKADAVWVHIPWRRRDADPQDKEIIVIDATTNKRVENVLRVRIDRESGDLLFQPATAPGEYHVYYMPFRTHGCCWWPTTVYPAPTDTADAEWTKRSQPPADRIRAGETAGIPAAKVLEFQAINEHHRFDPMEVTATADEMKKLQAANAGRAFLLFPEDRRFPIRMADDLPLRWIESGPRDSFAGEACRNEYYAFQIGVFAMDRNLNNVQVRFSPLKSTDRTIPAEALQCINAGGVDCFGNPMTRTINVAKGKVQPLWIGVDVPEDAAPGVYQGDVTISAEGVPPSVVKVALTVSDKSLPDRGDGETWRHSRLRWLNSKINIDDEVFAPYTPVAVDGREVGVLGRGMHVSDGGMLDGVRSTFGYSVDTIESPPREILAGAMKMVFETEAGRIAWKYGQPRVVSRSSGAVTWQTTATADGLSLVVTMKIQCDGWVSFDLAVKADRAVKFKDIRLEIPMRREVAKYLMGLGHKGGPRPAEWKWNPALSQNKVWVGDVNAGLFLKGWGYHRQPPHDGGCSIAEDGDRVVISETRGPRSLAAGGSLPLSFHLMITPTKILDKRHWQWKYYHRCSDPAEAVKTGAKIMNIHHANPPNPYINYPFIETDKLKKLVDDAHAHGMKLKIYYTLRELTSFTTEFWALRALNDEIFPPGPGFTKVNVPADAPPARPMMPDNELTLAGKDPALALTPTGNCWLAEHVITKYYPAWHHPFGNGHCDAAVVTYGNTRWNNYYLEGLAWLVKNVGIDGLYIDDFAYDHETMKRVRKTLDRNRPGCLIDLHTNGLQTPDFHKSPATFYIEHMSMIDSLWFGELFDYNETPDFWLTEISGIPYGLFGEMLEGGGNPWRGMLYGMSSRIYNSDPTPMWRFWDEFGIADARMIGYWDPACPVKTNCKDVLATVYAKPGNMLISIASWAKEPVKCKLDIDWKSLGIDPAKAKLTATEIERFQPVAEFAPSDEITVQPGRGWLLVLHE